MVAAALRSQLVRRRLLRMVPTALLIAVVNFGLLHLAPGDMADVLAGEAGSATPEFLAALRQQFGLDQPLGAQFLHYAWRLLHFDLGYSFRNSMPVSELILSHLGATTLLMLAALIPAAVLGTVLGAASARWHGRALDVLISVGANLGFSVPVFWVGLMLIVLFAVQLGWLPTGGYADLDVAHTGPAVMLDLMRHMALPVASLLIYYTAIYTRFARASMMEVRGLDFVRTARSKGLRPVRIEVRHIMRNGLMPLVTLTGLQLGTLLGGSVVVETVFSWPGLGRLAFDAVGARDVNLLLGILFCSSLLVILVNLLTDLTYAVFDRRIELD